MGYGDGSGERGEEGSNIKNFCRPSKTFVTVEGEGRGVLIGVGGRWGFFFFFRTLAWL